MYQRNLLAIFLGLFICSGSVCAQTAKNIPPDSLQAFALEANLTSCDAIVERLRQAEALLADNTRAIAKVNREITRLRVELSKTKNPFLARELRRQLAMWQGILKDLQFSRQKILELIARLELELWDCMQDMVDEILNPTPLI